MKVNSVLSNPEISYVHSLILQSFPESLAIKTRLEDDILVVMSRDFVLEFLNPVASDFLLLVNGRRSLVEIVLELQRIYDSDISTISIDVIELARELQRKRVIRLNSEPIEST